ncbi:MAG TPA: VOC family protein [Thermoplasmata archaeon]|nr:VOC family protein [Thermoplasmata archaeon]
MWLDYTGIRVTDLPKSLAFYTDVLGLAEIRRGTMDHGGVWVLLHHRHSRQYLELNWYPNGNRYAVPYSPGEALDHVGFSVRDVASAFEYLKRHGAVPTAVTPALTGGHAAYVLDPDGNWIELFTDPDLPFHLRYSAVRVTDLERSLRFYTGALGLREIVRGDLSAVGGGTFVGLSDPYSGQRLELDWYPPTSRFAVPFAVGEGLDHLGVRTEDPEASVRSLESAGGRLVDSVREPDGQLELAYVTDPDGTWIELIHQPDDYPKE